MSSSLQHGRQSGWNFSNKNNSVAVYTINSHPINGIDSDDLHVIERYCRYFGPSIIKGALRQGDTKLDLLLGIPILPHPIGMLPSYVDISDEDIKQIWSTVVREILALHKTGVCHGGLTTNCILTTKGIWDKVYIEPPACYSVVTSQLNDMRLNDLNFLLGIPHLSEADKQLVAEELGKSWTPALFSMANEKGLDYVPYFRECAKILTTVICDIASSSSLEVLFVSIELLHRMRRLLPKDISDPFGNKICGAVIGTAVSLSVKMSGRELPMSQIVHEIIKVCRIQEGFDASNIVEMEIAGIINIKGQLPRNCVFHRCTTMSQCLSLYRDFIIKATETTNYFGIRLSHLCDTYTTKASGPLNLLTVRDMFA